MGEAHYIGGREPRPKVTRDVVKRYGIEGKPHAFFTKCRRAVDPKRDDSSARRKSFWNSVAFYNYVQQAVGNTAREEEPTAAMWESAEAPFRAVLSDLKPEVVIVLGKRLWRHLPKPAGVVRVTDDEVGQLKLRVYEAGEGHRALAGHLTHPAGAIAYASARPRVRKLFQAARRQS